MEEGGDIVTTVFLHGGHGEYHGPEPEPYHVDGKEYRSTMGEYMIGIDALHGERASDFAWFGWGRISATISLSTSRMT